MACPPEDAGVSGGRFGSSLARVREVLGGGKATPPPCGELWNAPEVLASEGLPGSPLGVLAMTERLGADLCFLSCSGPLGLRGEPGAARAAADAVHAKGLACGAVVNGPWQRLTERDGLEPALRLAAADAGIESQLPMLAHEAQREVDIWVEADADLIVLADDVAYSGGPYFSPAVFDRLFLPHYRRLLSAAPRRPPIGFHSDGDVSLILPALVQAGFNHFSLQPEATNPRAVWQRFGRRVVLLTGIPAAWLTTPVAWPEVLSELAGLAGGGSLILASACGLFEATSVENLKVIYRLASGGAPPAA